jgi:endo-1,4-beta-xylanase
MKTSTVIAVYAAAFLVLLALEPAHAQIASGSNINLSVNGYYASAANGGGSNVTVDRGEARSWEAFTVASLYNSELYDGDSIQLQGNNGNYLGAECRGGEFGDSGSESPCGIVNANRFAALGWETFTVVKLGGSEGSLIQSGDQIALQSSGGFYCSAENGGGDGSYMNCIRGELGGWGWEIWTIAQADGNIPDLPPDDPPPIGGGLKDLPLVTSGRISIGAAAKYEFSEGDPNYFATFAREYNILTIEDNATFPEVQPDPASAFSPNEGWDFSAADAVVSFARQNGIVVRGHHLVMHQTAPTWFVQGGYSPDELYWIMRNRIQTEIAHFENQFPGVIQYWDVVNEAVSDGCRSIWSPVWGPDYVDPCLRYVFTAFQFAREITNSINPNIKLVINECCGVETTWEDCSVGGSSKACKFYDLALALRREGLIYAVGLQMHVFNPDWAPDFGALQYYIHQLGQIGLEVHITELDAGLYTPTPSDSELQWQASIYGGVARACLAEPNCTAILTWDFVDKYSWLTPEFGMFAPLPFDSNYSRKPAYFELQRALSGG